MDTIITACFYSFEESCIIQGKVVENNLVIHTLDFYKNTSIQYVGEILLIHKNKTQLWINTHEPLKTIVGFAYEFDILGDNSNEIQALEDVWLDLKNSQRIKANLTFRENSKSQEMALKILLKGLNKELFKKPVKNLMTATVKKHSSSIARYR
ncbi:hypothetical protein HW132_28730 [Brasilonema sp. CT11]|nr:hypothetical protein [Brasilonema sp. CT11]